MSTKGKRYLVALGVASIIVVGALVVGLGTFNSPAGTGSPSATTTSTSYAMAASSIIASAATHGPTGYAGGLSKPLNPKEAGLVSGGYAVFSNQGAALANMTILVFNSTQSAQTYGSSVISNAKDLAGYSDLTVSLSSYPHYGTCYGYGQADPEGAGAVATGVCTKGNVYIMVHVATSSSLPSAEEDMASFVGAAYQAIG